MYYVYMNVYMYVYVYGLVLERNWKKIKKQIKSVMIFYFHLKIIVIVHMTAFALMARTATCQWVASCIRSKLASTGGG